LNQLSKKKTLNQESNPYNPKKTPKKAFQQFLTKFYMKHAKIAS